MNARSLLIAFGMALLSQSPAFAITITFNPTTELAPLGETIANGDAVTNQWQAYGIVVSDAHWYDNFPTDTPPSFDGMGVANTARDGHILFLSPIDSVFVEWALSAAAGDGLHIEVFDSSGAELDTFRSPGNDLSGKATLTGIDIASLIWHDSGSQVAISTLTFPVPVNNVPEPDSLGLVGLALVGLAVIGRRRAA